MEKHPVTRFDSLPPLGRLNEKIFRNCSSPLFPIMLCLLRSLFALFYIRCVPPTTIKRWSHPSGFGLFAAIAAPPSLPLTSKHPSRYNRAALSVLEPWQFGGRSNPPNKRHTSTISGHEVTIHSQDPRQRRDGLRQRERDGSPRLPSHRSGFLLHRIIYQQAQL